MFSWWEALPGKIDPIAFSVGFFSVSWYAIFYLLGATTVVWLLHRRLAQAMPLLSKDEFWSLVSSVLWGMLIGGRLGYVLFYGETAIYMAEPWRIVSPYDLERGLWVGIRGMSFFGGLFGGALAVLVHTKRYRRSFLALTDWIVPALPLALFFGRLGNFINGELIGRPTEWVLGMRFASPDHALRHASQLYEAFGEGLALFLLLHFLKKHTKENGVLSGVFLVGYGCLRFFLEFYREPDLGSSLFFGLMTINQAFSLALFAVGLTLIYRLNPLCYNKSKEYPS